MLNAKHLVLFLMIFLVCSCQSSGDYFNRRDIKPAINSNCGAFQNGVLIDATNYISVSPEDYQYLLEYFEDKEDRLYKCLKFGRCK